MHTKQDRKGFVWFAKKLYRRRKTLLNALYGIRQSLTETLFSILQNDANFSNLTDHDRILC